jgi:trans-2-enoyl-CoA reductase
MAEDLTKTIMYSLAMVCVALVVVLILRTNELKTLGTHNSDLERNITDLNNRLQKECGAELSVYKMAAENAQQDFIESISKNNQLVFYPDKPEKVTMTNCINEYEKLYGLYESGQSNLYKCAYANVIAGVNR